MLNSGRSKIFDLKLTLLAKSQTSILRRFRLAPLRAPNAQAQALHARIRFVGRRQVREDLRACDCKYPRQNQPLTRCQVRALHAPASELRAHADTRDARRRRHATSHGRHPRSC